MDDDDDDEPEEYLAYLFDFVTGTEVNREKAALLKVLFEDASKIKIFHDSRRDAEALYHQLGISLKNVCDTQVSVHTVPSPLLAARLTKSTAGVLRAHQRNAALAANR